MRRWINRIVLIVVLGGIVAALVWSMWPQPVPVEVVTVGRGPLQVSVVEDGRAVVEDRYLVTTPLAAGPQRAARRRSGGGRRGGRADRACRRRSTRTRSRLTGRVDVAQAQRPGRGRGRRARLAADFATRERERLTALVTTRTVPGIELDRASLSAEVAARDLASAQFAAAVASHALTTAQAMAARAGKPGDDEIVVEAPVSGQVLRVLTESAGVVGPGTPLLELGDPQRLEIVADVLTADAVAIRPGAPVTITGWGGAPVAGRVRRVEPSATTRLSALGVEEQRVAVVIDLAAPPAAWAGMGDGWRVEVEIVTVEVPDAITVPLGALRRDGDGWSVFVVTGGVAHRRGVQLGHKNRDAAEITAGLAAGDRVTIRPGERIGDGVRVAAR
jgi:HlyD family secretion protein